MHRESLQNSATVTYDQLQASLLSSDSRMLHQMTDMIFDLLSQENNTYFWGAQLFSLCRKATADGFKTCNWILISWVAQLHFDTQIWTVDNKSKVAKAASLLKCNLRQCWTMMSKMQAPSTFEILFCISKLALFSVQIQSFEP